MVHESAPTHTPARNVASAHRNRLDAEYDAIVQLIYRAAAGLEQWTVALARIAKASDARSVGVTAFDKVTGAVIYNNSAGARPPEALTEYIREYHRIDPRLDVMRPLPIGQWFACQDHFDDEFVARHPFYQKFLLRHGTRYVYATKVEENDATMVVLAHHRPPGHPLVDRDERSIIERLGIHVVEAMRIQRQLGNVVERDALGYALLDRLHEPAVLLDRDRNIIFRSDAAKAILDRGDFVAARRGVLTCRDAESDVALTMALRELALGGANGQGPDRLPEQRRTLRFRCAEGSRVIVATLFALRSTAGIRAPGPALRALMVIHEPGSTKDIAPGFLSSTFKFTPAEARVAARLAAGLTAEEIATEFKVSIATVRTQLKSAFEKTGTKRQAELVRLLLAISAI